MRRVGGIMMPTIYVYYLVYSLSIYVYCSLRYVYYICVPCVFYVNMCVHIMCTICGICRGVSTILMICAEVYAPYWQNQGVSTVHVIYF